MRELLEAIAQPDEAASNGPAPTVSLGRSAGPGGQELALLPYARWAAQQLRDGSCPLSVTFRTARPPIVTYRDRVECHRNCCEWHTGQGESGAYGNKLGLGRPWPVTTNPHICEDAFHGLDRRRDGAGIGFHRRHTEAVVDMRKRTPDLMSSST